MVGRSTQRVGAALVVALGLVLAATDAAPASAGGAVPRTRVIEAAAWLPRGSVLLGRAAASTPLTLDVALSPRSPSALERFATDVSTPGTGAYRDYLARGAFATRFGPSPAALSRVLATLHGLGLRRTHVSGDHLVVSVRTTAGVANAAFSTTIDRLRLASGAPAYANVTGAVLPASVAHDVLGVFGLADTMRLAPAGGARRAPRTSRPDGRGARATGPTPCAGAASTGAATADVLAGAYGLDGLYRDGDLGQGETIALFEPAAYDATDVAVYQRCYRTHAAVALTRIDGGTPIGSGTLEATADVEDLAGLAPRARIDVYETSNEFTPDWLDEWSAIVDRDTASVVSTSWLACESVEPTGFAAAEAAFFEQAAAQGQTVLAASGDYGAEGCDQFFATGELSVDDPASDPFVTGVGGTQWKGTSRSTERAWNDPSTGASGGGLSSVWPMPSWQAGPGVQNRFSSATPCAAVGRDCRETPDVSALAGPPFYAFYCNAGDCGSVGGWGWFYGTSFATPLWAASVALADERCTATPPLGFLDPSLYAVAATPMGGLHDVTVGETDFTRSNHGDYPATPGYDLATGLGTPEWTTGTAVLGLAGLLCDLARTPPAAQASALVAPHGAAGDPHASMAAVACTATSRCSAVGTFSDAGGDVEAMAANEVDGTWRTPSEVDAPTGAAGDPDASLDAVACTGPGACTAVGSYVDASGDTEGMVTTERGGDWGHAVALPAPTGAASDPIVALKGVACTSTGDCVAVGSDEDASGHAQAIVTDETDGVWASATVVLLPTGAATDPLASLNAVSCAAPGSCTASGTYTTTLGAGTPMVDAVGGATPLRAVPLTVPAGAASDPEGDLLGISCPGAGRCIAVGSYAVASGTEAMVLTESGSAWARARALAATAGASAAPDATLRAVACVAVGSCTVVGDDAAASGAHVGVLATEDGRTWARTTALAAPAGAAANPLAQLDGLACPSAGSCVAVGGYATRAGDAASLAVRAALPTLRRVSPGAGPGTGGAAAYLVGTGLEGALAVHFGTATARIDGLVSPAELKVTVPAGHGAVLVTVTTAWGTSALTGSARYTYVRARR